VERIKKQLSTRAMTETGLSGSEDLPRVTQSGSLAKALTSRAGVLVIFPALVLCLGAYLTWLAQDALKQSNLELAESRMKDEALLVSEHLSSALGQADLLLENLQSFAQTLNTTTPPETVALPFRRLIYGRPGASYVSISFPDGMFEGAFVDQDGAIRFQTSRLTDGYTEERIYDYVAGETIVLRQVRRSQYDPRTRPFYQLAAEADGAVWTEPYPFAGTGDTGITRALALRSGPALKAVLTFDFDVRRLSPLLARQDAHTERPVLFDERGTILADPQVKLPRAAQNGSFELLNYRSLNDPVLSSFFAHRSQAPFLSFETNQGPYLAATAHLTGEGRPDWVVAFLAPESSFLASLETHKRRSYLSAALALLVVTGLSAAFAELIVRVRKEASEAREAARRARKEAREMGSYRLVERLGEGGMGEVWLAEHRLLAREAAIKLIKNESDQAVDEVARKRFRREAQSLAALRSRNTIEIYDYGVTEDGTFFFVMELLDGLDLDTLIQRDGPQAPARVVGILIQACGSLAEAHEAGLVHRDIKPANIFICRVADELDVVKVLDFGLVRTLAEGPEGEPMTKSAFGSAPTLATASLKPSPSEPSPAPTGASAAPSGPRLTRADHIMGTPEFMAPEQALGASVDARADIYALGCVAFWLLTGQTVFRGRTVVAQIAAHVAEPPPNVGAVSPTPLPQSLVALVASCLAKAPEDRPQTARELKELLQDVQRELDGSWEAKVGDWWNHHMPRATRRGSTASLEAEIVSARTIAQPIHTLPPIVDPKIHRG
jgi:serine/threonine protein kinase